MGQTTDATRPMQPLPNVTPVILCGGKGTRLWPLSRKSYPKQFSALLEAESLFEQTVARFLSPVYTAPIVVTGEPFRFIVTALTAKAGAIDPTILIEPVGRNTAPAALAAAFAAHAHDPEAVLLLVPSDHLIPDTSAFHAAVAAGFSQAAAGHIVTFGVRPDRAETGYGYLELDNSAEGFAAANPIPVRRFVEKPDAQRAQTLSTDGRHLWNSGIFLAQASTIIEAFRTHAPEFLEPVRKAVETAKTDLDFLRLAPQPWTSLPSISIDFAVMERVSDIVAVPLSAGWTDLGDWDAVWRELPHDPQGVAKFGNVSAIECANTLLRSDSDGVQLVGIGLENVIAIAMDDAVLVADKSRAQDVGLAVEGLKRSGARQADQLPKDYRPWGWYESLALGDRFQVKRIVVNPGAALSLQSHVHRAEHWIIVEGTAKVTVDKSEKLLTENESIYIPLGAVHRLENPGKLPLVLIEEQTGAYLEEDDITRYGDAYDRE